MLGFITLNTGTALAGSAGINQTINYQGRLLTATGAVVPDGTYNMEFQIWQDGNGCVTGCTSANAATNNGGTLKWTEDWVYGTGSPDNRVTVKNGYFSVSLGSITSLSGVNFNWDTNYLTTNIGDTSTAATFSVASGDGYMIPFKRLSANPYAINSGQLGGLTSSQYVQLGQGIQAVSSTNAAIGVNATSTGNILDLQKGGADVQLINNSGQTLFRPTTDSQTALQVQKAGSTTVVFTVDSTNSRIGIGTGTPAYSVDAVGTVNASTSLAVAGTNVCTSSGCTPTSTSGAYIQNQIAGAQTSSNFYISGTGVASALGINNSTAANPLAVNTLTTAQSGYQAAISTALSTNNGLVIQGVVSQGGSTRLLNVQNSGGTSLFSIAGDGTARFGSGTVLSLPGVNGGSLSKTYTVGTGGVSQYDVVVLANDGGTARILDSTTAYDTRVAGISNNSATSGNTADISITGAYIVNYTGTAPALGDQLVVSSTAGKVTVDNTATQGILGYATAAGSAGTVSVRIQITSGVTNPNYLSNVTIQGSGTAVTSLQAPLFDTASAVALNIGTTNATSINLNKSTNLATSKNLTFLSGTGYFDQSASTGAFLTGSGNVSLNGNTTIASGKTLTVNGGTTFNSGVTQTTSTVSNYTTSNFGLSANSSASQLNMTGTGTNDIFQQNYFNAYSTQLTSSTNTLQGTEFETQNTGTATLGNVNGVQSLVDNTSTGTITNAVAGEFGYKKATGTITNGYSLSLDNVAGQATNAYSIYSNGGANVLLSGAAGVNDLTLQGAASQTGNLLQVQDNLGDIFDSFSGAGNLTANGSTTMFNGLAVPVTITLGTVGTAGSTTYAYRVSALNAQGETIAAPEVTISTGNATLSGTNYVTVTFSSVAGATSYKVYGRTTGAELYMATIASTGSATASYVYNDTGAVTPSGALPATGNLSTTLSVNGAYSNSASNIFNVNKLINGGVYQSVLAVSGFGLTSLTGALSVYNSYNNNNTALNVVSAGTSTSSVGLSVQGAVGQTANLFQLQDSASNINASFSNTGNKLTLGRIAASGTVTAGSVVLGDGTTDNFGATLNTSTLTASRTISLPDAGGTICTTVATTCSSTYAASGGSYISNTTTPQTNANFSIQAASGTVAATIKGAASQYIANFVSSGGTTVASIDPNGYLSATYVSSAGGGFSGTTAIGGTDLNIATNNTNVSSGTQTTYGIGILPAGSANSVGSNISVGIGLSTPTPQTGNAFYGIAVGTGYNALLLYNNTSLIDGGGILQNAAIGSTLSYTNLNKVGTLTSGSIASGFGSISTASNIGTTATLSGGNLTVTATSGVGAVIQGGSGSDIADFKTSGGVLAATVDASGNLATTGTVLSQASFAGNHNYFNAGATNTNSTATTSTLNAYNLSLTGGTNTTPGANVLNGVNFAAVTPVTNNVFNGLNFGTGYTNLLTYNSATLINGTGILQNAAFSGTYSGITGTGTLTAGALGTGFTAVAPAQGGTGLTGYTTGDLLYASSSSVLASLSDVSTGSCLVSGGVGVSPSWGSCSGTGGTYVSLQSSTPGTADTGNFNISGTGIVNTLKVSTSGGIDTTAVGVLKLASTNATAVSVGSNGTVTGQLYVGGKVSTTATGTKALPSASSSYGTATLGNYAFIGDNTNHLLNIYDVSDPANIRLVSSTSSGIAFVRMIAVGKYLYIHTGVSGNSIAIYSLANMNAPVLLSNTTMFAPQDMAVQGHYLYADTGLGGNNVLLNIYDVSNETSPVLVSSYTTPNTAAGGARGITVLGRYAYIVDTSGYIQTIDISNPTAPYYVGRVATPDISDDYISSQGTYLYTTQGSVVSIASPAAPTYVSALPSYSDLPPVISGNYLYGTRSGSLYVFNMSNAASPTSVGTYATTGGLIGVRGRYALMTDGTNLRTYDLGGAYVQELQTGDLETSTLNVESDTNIGGNLSLQGGLTATSINSLNVATAALTIAPTTSVAPPAALGTTGVTGSFDNGDQNDNIADQFTTGASSQTISYLNIYVGPVDTAPNNQFKMALYADSSNSPSTLLAISNASTLIPNSWNSVPIPTTTLAASTKYWIASNTNSSSNVLNQPSFSGATGYIAEKVVAYGTYPNPFNPDFVTGSSNEWSMYASATSSSPIDTVLSVQNSSGQNAFGVSAANNSATIAGVVGPTYYNSSTSTSGGTLAAGTYYYYATSIDGAGGESLPVNEHNYTTTGSTGSIFMQWYAVPGAASYRIYRGTASGAENVYYTTTSTSFTDTNAAATAGLPPKVATAASVHASATGLSIQSAVNNTTAFQVQSSNGTALLTADTTNTKVLIAGTSYNATNITFAAAGTISSTGNTGLTLDTGTAGGSATVSLGDTNASQIRVGTSNSAHTIDIGDGGTSTTQTVGLGSSNTGSATTFKGAGISQILGTNSDTVKSVTNSTTAFQVQNASAIPIFVVDTSTSSNLITNPGFEANTTGWALSGSATIAQNLTKTNTYNGLASLLVTTSATGAGATVSGFTSTITPAQYTFSFYAKGGTNTGALSATVTGGSAPTCTLSSTAFITTGFQRYSCTFTSTTTNVTAINILTTGGVSGTFWIDGAQLVTGASNTPYSAPGAVQIRGVINNPVAIQNLSNSTTAFQVQNAAGTSNTFVVDTVNNTLTLGGSALASTINAGATGSAAFASTINLGVSTGATQTVTIGGSSSAAASGSTVVIQGGTAATGIQIGSGNIAHGIQIGAGGTSTAQAIVIGSIGSTSKTSLIGGVITTTNNQAGVIIGSGFSTSGDTSLVPLVLDTTQTFAETASTCSASVNGGALYYNSTSNSVRACQDSLWSDVATTKDLGLLMFGVVPESGPTPGDLAGITGTDAANGPCKVYMGSVANSVRWTGCTVYAYGRRQVIAAQSTDYTTGITTTGSAYQNLCIFTAGSAPTFGTGAAETIASLPTGWTENTPTLCLATIKEISAGSGIGVIYDSRIFTDSVKQPIVLNTVMGFGTAVKLSNTVGVIAPTSATSDPFYGVLASFSGTASTTTVNAIVVTSGPAWVKTVTGTAGQYVKPTATAGYVSTSALVTSAQTDIPYNYLGIAQTTYNAPGTQCITTANADTCRGSILVNVSIR